MGFEQLKEDVCRANLALVRSGLVVLTWGNASGVDRQAGVMAIKPSGVAYDQLRPQDIIILSIDKGEVIQGTLRPSSDTPTHLLLYQGFPSIGGIVHTHSAYATSWAQAGREIPCLGTTHADHFHGHIPLTRQLTSEEIAGAYERNTGKVILECFSTKGINPEEIPGVLVAQHGPFAWGATSMAAADNAIILEEVARIALYTLLLTPEAGQLPRELMDKHFNRKHGSGAYYGQK